MTKTLLPDAAHQHCATNELVCTATDKSEMNKPDPTYGSADHATAVIALFGLGHSGSTVLERCLASHPNCVGLGEICNTLRTASREGLEAFPPCTCGEQAAYCPVWGILASGIENDAEAVERIIKKARLWTNRSVIIDSSKATEQQDVYDVLVREKQVEILSVWLVRDFRAWALSSKFRRRDWGLGILPYIARCWYWLYRNEVTRQRISSATGHVTLVLYETFVDNPDAIVSDLWKRIGLPACEANPARCCQHALKGNAMRFDPERNSRVVANSEWRRDWRARWLTPFVFGPWLYLLWLRRLSARRRAQ